MQNRNHWSLLLFLGLGIAGFSASAQADFAGEVDEIVGGKTVRAEDPVASSTVLLVGKGDQGDYLCTASIISRDTLVTAAHCLAAAPEEIKIVFSRKMNGKKKKLDSGHVMAISGYLVNPNYKGEGYQGEEMGDIGVIHLTGELPDGYMPATLLTRGSSLKPEMSTILAGYGATNGRTEKGVGVLRKVNATIVELLGSTEVRIDETKHKGSCNGDSGGPAFLQDGDRLLLWGVTSRGDAECAQESIYTRIDAYRSWIRTASEHLRHADSYEAQ